MKKQWLLLIFILAFFIVSCGDDSDKTEKVDLKSPTISPISGTYNIDQSISISCETDGVDIYYTTDGTTPSANSIKYIQPFNLSIGTYVIKSISSLNGKNSEVVEANYKIEPLAEGLTVYFYKPSNWGETVYIHYWDTEPDIGETVWPGEIMTNLNDGWYSYTIEGVNSSNVIFNDGTEQTSDLTRAKLGWFKDGIWYDSKPAQSNCEGVTCSNHGTCIENNGTAECNCDEGYHAEGLNCIEDTVDPCEGVMCSNHGTCINNNGIAECNCDDGYHADQLTCIEDIVDPCEGVTCSNHGSCIDNNGTAECNCDEGYIADQLNCVLDADGLVVHFKKPSNWGTPKIHYWNTSPDIGSTEWPGENMILDQGDWYYYIIEGADSANIVFNDGSGNQTTDLTRDSEGWYKENQWYDQYPDGPVIPIVQASPSGGSFIEPISVTLQSSNLDDTIYYTIDGSNVTTSSSVYNSSITISESCTLQTFAVNSLGESGDIYRFDFVIDPDLDIEDPAVTASLDPGVYENSIEVNFTITDNKESSTVAYYTTNGTLPTEESPIYQQGDATSGLTGENISITDTTTVKFLVIDGAGNELRENFHYQIGEIELTDFREETIYFLLTARFYDGDSENNYYNRDRIRFDDSGNPIDPHWRGDFKGLIEKLDYIADLGFTAIWITPPIENRSGLDYHGYHGYDWYQIDPRLESEGATYQDLINEARARGIKIIQDVVVNHSSQYGIRNQVFIDRLPIKYYVPQGLSQGMIDNGPYQGNLGDYKHPFKEDNDNPIAPDWFKAAQDSDPDGTNSFVDPLTGTTLPLAGYNPNRFFSFDPMTLDPEWYHLDGFMAGGDWENPEAIQVKHLAGDCVDLATEKQHVKDYLNGAIHQYLDMGVAAIRVDTVKHITRENLLEFVHDWQQYKPGLFVFGENLVKGTGWGNLFGDDNAPSRMRPWWYTRTGNDESNPTGDYTGFSVLDFGLFSTFRDNVSQGHYGGIGGVLARDYVYGDATQLVTFLQNHDVGPDNDFKYRFQGEQWMAAITYNLLWTIRGIPCLYYGEEIEFQKGMPQDICGNDDTLESTGRAYFGDFIDDDNSDGHTMATTQQNPLYQHIKRLNEIRRSIPALQKAPMSNVNEWGSGISFTRDYNNGESYVAVGLTTGDPNNLDINGETITVRNVRSGRYVDAVTGNVINVKGDSITFFVKKNSAGIYVLNGKGQIGKTGKYLR